MSDYEPKPLPDWPPTGEPPPSLGAWPPESVGHYMDRYNVLQTIASVYVREPVRIAWQWERNVLGWAGWHYGWVITLNPGGHAVALGQTFFHEIAHIILGHVERENDEDGDSVADPDQLHPLDVWRAKTETAPTDVVAAMMVGTIEQWEGEADAWAERALREFEAKYGPFLDFIGGRV